GAVEEALAADLPLVGEQERFLVAGAGRALPPAHEAVLKLPGGAGVGAGGDETERLLHGHLPPGDQAGRAVGLEGEGGAGGGAGRQRRRRSTSSAATSTCCRRGIRSSTSCSSSGSRSSSPSSAGASRTGSGVTIHAGSRPPRRRRRTTRPREPRGAGRPPRRC